MKKIQKSLFENKNNWKTKKLAFPKATIRVGSLFSGIGAFEQALKILNHLSQILFQEQYLQKKILETISKIKIIFN